MTAGFVKCSQSLFEFTAWETNSCTYLLASDLLLLTCDENAFQVGRLSNTAGQVSIVIAHKNKQGERCITSQSTSNPFQSSALLTTSAPRSNSFRVEV